MPEFLLEIGCEEIPASWLAGLGEQLRERFAENAAKEHLQPTDVRTLVAPRRLALSAQVVERQPDREERAWGPAVRAAKDAAGAWTQAAQGFAKKNAVDPAAFLEGMKEGGKEPQLYVAKTVAGRATAEVLPSVIAATLRGLAFPKRMSWDAWLDDGRGAFPFGRPIRWMVALLGGAVVPFEVFELVAGAKGPLVLKSGNESRGHRFLPKGATGKPVRVTSLSDLTSGLEKACVILDPAEREARIRKGLESKGAPAEALRHELVAEWRDLVEYPTVMAGPLPGQFRSLPVEVLETVLVHHQKYVPLLEGGTVTRFAAVTNTDPAAEAEVVRGMQRVVVARLRDAAFFLGEDRKRALSTRVDDLSGVTFHQGLGTYADKAQRLVKLIDALGDALPSGVRQHARDAARLAKADLTALMVREFTELQGVMGGIYLRDEGVPAPVAEAVRWHYHPVSVDEDSAPAGKLDGDARAVFAAVSLVDKIDTLAGYFGLGMVPSGSSDPYGLRRAGQGAIRVVLDFWPEGAPRPDLRQLFAAAGAGYPAFKRSAEEIDKDGEAFLLDRLRYVLVSRGGAADEVEAVLGARAQHALADVRAVAANLGTLHRVRSTANADFLQLAAAFKRASNLLAKAGTAGRLVGTVDPARLTEPAEVALYEAIQKSRTPETDSTEERLRRFATLRPAVDTFFDKVLVMHEDEGIRGNRLGLIELLVNPITRIADISRLGG